MIKSRIKIPWSDYWLLIMGVLFVIGTILRPIPTRGKGGAIVEPWQGFAAGVILIAASVLILVRHRNRNS
jgi:hypothetical protein